MADLHSGITRFLQAAGWGAASIGPVTGDASVRIYHRLRLGRRSAILMDARADGRTRAFTRIGQHLRTLGLSAPKILAADHDAGLLLLEDLGDDVFPAVIDRDPTQQKRLYSGAIDTLAVLASHPPPPDLPLFDAPQMAEIARMVVDWYQPAATGTPPNGAAEFTAILHRVAKPLIAGPPALMLRDFHAGNLIWLPRRSVPARVGLLDFQDAMAAHPAYDLVSLLQDARRDVPPELERAMIRRYVAATAPQGDFAAAYAVMGAQRALRIMGIFARLSLHFAKPQYLIHLPRVYDQLQRNLCHPALAELADLCQRLIPEPTQAILNRIESLCGTIPTP